MSHVTYTLCALMALVCAVMLLLAYRRSRYELLLWSGVCFVGLTVNNLLVVADKLVFVGVDLYTWRLLVGLVSMVVLLYGLIWKTE